MPDEMRFYSVEEAAALTGKMMVCDEKECDGEPCRYHHNTPHEYNDMECFCSCNWPGHNGFCVPAEKDV